MKTRLLVAAVVLAVLGAIAWGGLRAAKALGASTSSEIPATRIRKGRVTIAVSARGELQGGNSEVLTGPMIGGTDLIITELRQPGELVEAGDVIVQFDTTMQEYNLREAQADLAESEQLVIKAEADSLASDEEARWAVASAQSEVKLAELELKKNSIMPAIQAKQNEIALQAAKNRLRQAEEDLKNKKTTAAAAIAIQKAAQNKSRVMSEMQQHNIESMTLHAKTGGYVNVAENRNGTMMWFRGMTLPQFQVGDTARSGQAIVQIPDLKNWEVSASVGELDRGHLAIGQKVAVSVVALAGKSFGGHVKLLGGTSGPPWDRRFECRITLDEASPELRPGMTSNMLITVESLDDVLWAPSQALFESDGRTFVYLKGLNGFVQHDVKMVRRSESQVILGGVKEGDVVALSNPDLQMKPAGAAGQKSGAMKALAK